MNFKSQFYIFSILSLLMTPIGLLIRMFYSRSLSLEDFGLIYAIIGFFGFFAMFIQFGMDQSIKYYFPKFILKKQNDKIRNSLFMIYLSTISIFLIFGFFIFYFIEKISSDFFNYPGSELFILIFLGYSLFVNLIAPISNLFLVYKKIYYAQVVYLVKFLFIFLVSIFVSSFFSDSLMLVFSIIWVVSIFLSFIYYLIIVYLDFPFIFQKPSFDFSLFKELFKYGFYGMFSNLGNVILAQIDILMITFLLGTAAVGVYGNAVALIGILFLLTTHSTVLLVPLFAELKEKKDFFKMGEILSSIYKVGIFLLLPFCLIFYLFSDLIISLIFTDKFVLNNLVLPIFAFFALFKVLYHFNISILNGLGEVKLTSKLILFAAIVNIFLNLVLFYYLGLDGFALGTGIGWFILFILSFFNLNKFVNFNFSFNLLFRNVLILGIFYFLVILLKKLFISINFYISSFLILFVSISIYFILGYFLRIYDFNDVSYFLPDFFKEKFNFLKKKLF